MTLAHSMMAMLSSAITAPNCRCTIRVLCRMNWRAPKRWLMPDSMKRAPRLRKCASARYATPGSGRHCQSHQPLRGSPPDYKSISTWMPRQHASGMNEQSHLSHGRGGIAQHRAPRTLDTSAHYAAQRRYGSFADANRGRRRRFDTSRPQPGHFGLIGLREQAQLIGADFEIRSAPDQGTMLRLALRVARYCSGPQTAALTYPRVLHAERIHDLFHMRGLHGDLLRFCAHQIPYRPRRRGTRPHPAPARTHRAGRND